MRRPLSASPEFLVTLAALLALAHALMAVTAMTEKSMTSDEIAHLVAGQAYNTRGDYRLQPENGNLPQRLAALPMTLAGVDLPPTSLDSWRIADIWRYGYRFFYEEGLSGDAWLFLGRTMIALVNAGTALLVFLWSRSLFGLSGGFISLLLFVFCPTFLAHGALTTSDATMTFFFLAAVGAGWRHLERPGFKGGLLSATMLGLAFVTKFSAVLLIPTLSLIGGVWALGQARRTGWRAPLFRLARTTLGHGAAAWLTIWLFYGFRYSAFAPEFAAGGSFQHGWGSLMPLDGLPGKFIEWGRAWRALPEAWLYGLTFVLQFSRARGAFMSGDYSTTGWVLFFPFAFLIKTTVPLLVLLAGGALAAGTQYLRQPWVTLAARLRPFTPLAALFLVYGATSLASHLNIGHRHILPIYPVLFIAAGYLGRWVDRSRPLATFLITSLLLWHAGESLRARPHYLAYFNQIVGGSSHGWRHLVDSSLDWGQDLPGLRRWLDTHARQEPIFIAYFGTGDPAYEGIRAIALPALPEVGPRRRWHALSPGYYAISATMLQHVYSPFRGDWTLAWENEFQTLRRLEPLLLAYQNDPARRLALQREAPIQNWTASWQRYELLRFARLCGYLRARPPEAAIGHSLFVFKLNAQEIAHAVYGSAQDWAQAIETTLHQPLTPDSAALR